MLILGVGDLEPRCLILPAFLVGLPWREHLAQEIVAEVAKGCIREVQVELKAGWVVRVLEFLVEGFSLDFYWKVLSEGAFIEGRRLRKVGDADGVALDGGIVLDEKEIKTTVFLRELSSAHEEVDPAINVENLVIEQGMRNLRGRFRGEFQQKVSVGLGGVLVVVEDVLAGLDFEQTTEEGDASGGEVETRRDVPY